MFYQIKPTDSGYVVYCSGFETKPVKQKEHAYYLQFNLDQVDATIDYGAKHLGGEYPQTKQSSTGYYVQTKSGFITNITEHKEWADILCTEIRNLVQFIERRNNVHNKKHT